MSKLTRKNVFSALIGCWLVLAATPTLAYIGPGAGVGAIGTFLAVIGTVLLMIVGFVRYPIKRLFKGKKTPEAAEQSEESPNDS